MASSKRLEGKVAIITGGASGIGASAVRVFHENGAKVVVADIEDDLGQSLAKELGENVSYFHCDVTKEEDVETLVDTTVAKHGKLDIMYNNAGVLDKRRGGILDATIKDLDYVIGVNLVGAFLGAKHASRVMIPRREGCILFTISASTSIGGLSTHTYVASKYAVLGLARNLAYELGEYGIRVNGVSPFGVATSVSNANGIDKLRMEKFYNKTGNLKGHTLEADDIARAALFLASDEAHYISGLNLVIDGGFSVVNPSLNFYNRN